MGRLDTRYAPVRRSPSEIASNLHAAPRLACVKPVASVHPEPGSNSPLYKYPFELAPHTEKNRQPDIPENPFQRMTAQDSACLYSERSVFSLSPLPGISGGLPLKTRYDVTIYIILYI